MKSLNMEDATIKSYEGEANILLRSMLVVSLVYQLT